MIEGQHIKGKLVILHNNKDWLREIKNIDGQVLPWTIGEISEEGYEILQGHRRYKVLVKKGNCLEYSANGIRFDKVEVLKDIIKKVKSDRDGV